MQQLFRLGVWILFYTSVAGFLLSTVLGAKPVRDELTRLWVTSKLRSLALPNDAASRLQEKYLRAFYLTPQGRVSTLKLIRISFAVTLLTLMSHFAAYSAAIPERDSSELFFGALASGALLLLSTFVLTIPVEYLLAQLSLRVFRLTQVPVLRTLLLALTFLVTIAFFAEVSAILAPTQETLVGQYQPMFFAPSFLVNPTYHNFWQQIMSASASSEAATFIAGVASLLALSVSGLVVVGSALGSIIAGSKTLHAGLVKLIGVFAFVSTEQLLSASVIGFTVATGLMQASTF